MTPSDKLTALSILSGKLFRTKEEKGLHSAVIASLLNDLTPKDKLSLLVTEVYVDSPSVKTEYDTFADAMSRIELIRNKEKLYAVHITRGEETEYSWKSQN